MTHVPCSGETPRSPAIADSDTLAIDVSRTFMNVASETAIVPRTSALPFSGVGADIRVYSLLERRGRHGNGAGISAGRGRRVQRDGCEAARRGPAFVHRDDRLHALVGEVVDRAVHRARIRGRSPHDARQALARLH